MFDASRNIFTLRGIKPENKRDSTYTEIRELIDNQNKNKLNVNDLKNKAKTKIKRKIV